MIVDQNTMVVPSQWSLAAHFAESSSIWKNSNTEIGIFVGDNRSAVISAVKLLLIITSSNCQIEIMH